MQTLTADEYAALAERARNYRDARLKTLKKQTEYNPKLGVDALCFQRWQDGGLEERGLVGALISPCALSLIAIPEPEKLQGGPPDTLLLHLPSGRYRLQHCSLDGVAWYQRVILDDLSEIESMQEAAQLAQKLMERLMRPSE
ncbi:[NiFe]-hydrogenase assembly chaperone HybE [Halomonas vilamensis]|uniref:[NiFe]-hydrogenase assembly chaperone HybE n=1 Tax=Vreelandella vilamensis TaxID=531309 RepID=A0ABU1H2Z5_9GAMM|nr:[NiFe]-hydrogenase assembly chaperone HybE [Halomonas vilamensis]MDR5898221.1 [NiFe]-hydrogenase assembly chaperone HybE [Halomonas vilamensis]